MKGRTFLRLLRKVGKRWIMTRWSFMSFVISWSQTKFFGLLKISKKDRFLKVKVSGDGSLVVKDIYLGVRLPFTLGLVRC